MLTHKSIRWIMEKTISQFWFMLFILPASQEMEIAAAAEAEDGAKIMTTSVIKPLHKIISEHKDVVKIVIQLNSIISTFKLEVQEVIDNFSNYSHLWEKVGSIVKCFVFVGVIFLLYLRFDDETWIHNPCVIAKWLCLLQMLKWIFSVEIFKIEFPVLKCECFCCRRWYHPSKNLWRLNP